MKRHFSQKEVLEMVMQPFSDSSEEDTTSDIEWSPESSTSVGTSDPSSESGEDTEDPVHPDTEWTAKNGLVWSPSHAETLPYIQTTTAVSYIPRRGRNVLLLSSKHREPAVCEDEKQKAQIIIDYNRCKAGVDNLDKVISTYNCRRRTLRWPLILFFNCIDVSAFNAFVLFTAVDPSWNQHKAFRRRLFLEELGKAMVSPEIMQRKRLPHAEAAAAIVVDLQTTTGLTETSNTATATASSTRKRSRCWMCAGLKKKSASTCTKCNKCICRDHLVTCCRTCWSAAEN
ncbi:hypothetical protein GBF38_016615 [Nibea albiflora]|uniref:Uncharacterized protein n=1 Tax=Nibea albiflora TaxID=240163 RepID=A0ACB7ESF6_NIBAL|nr:hypothetical protein GBF38_016615 [Nibea albiflora]